MKISGFSYVRNGFDYGVPFLEAIQSILPICDEFVVVVGDSTDGTREAILQLGSDKIKIVDTVWDFSINKYGKIFAMQSNAGLDHITGDWAFHIQADEIIHEDDLPKIKAAIEQHENDYSIDGFILPFIHFWGSYSYIRKSRRVHQNEVRVFRNTKDIRSYKDSLGFRKYKDFSLYEKGLEKGKKLLVKKLNAPVYHYSEVRNPATNKKMETIGYFYAELKKNGQERKYHPSTGYDRLVKFTGTHPQIMQSKVNAQDWHFEFDKSKAHWKLKDRIMTPIEDFIGFRIGEYRNFIEVK